MKKSTDKLLYSAFGGIVGAIGIISLSRCKGKGCTACFGCAGVGIGLLLIALFNKFKRVRSLD
ncbi:MAG: hypothetical protein KKC21_05755 [Nitrospinae bacterium]|nr:hypothetical protein [Nitrospinota bacterium]